MACVPKKWGTDWNSGGSCKHFSGFVPVIFCPPTFSRLILPLPKSNVLGVQRLAHVSSACAGSPCIFTVSTQGFLF